MAIKLGNLQLKTGSVGVDLEYANGEPIFDTDGKTQAKAFVFGRASKQFRDYDKAKMRNC